MIKMKNPNAFPIGKKFGFFICGGDCWTRTSDLLRVKYGEHNVDKGIPTHSLLDSAIRHAAKYLAGYVDEPHLVAAAWNLLWAIEMEIVHPECVDTPWRAADGE